MYFRALLASKKVGVILFLLITAHASYGQLINNPTDIPNVQLWLDASDPNDNVSVPSDGGSINTWQDRSGLNNDAKVLAGQGPATFRSLPGLQINGNPVMEFSRNNTNSGDVYNVAGLDMRPATNPDITVFVVYKQKNTAITDNGVWGLDNGDWDRFFYIRHSGFGDTFNDGIVGLGPGDQAAIVVDAALPSKTRLLSVVYDGEVSGGINSGPTNGSLVRFGGTIVTNFTDTTNANNQGASLNIGWDGDNGAGEFYLAEFIVYNRLLTECETSQVVDYLSIKYGENFSQTIIAQTQNSEICIPDDAVFNVTTVGTGLTYQWQESIGGGTFTDITDSILFSGATTNTLTLASPPVSYTGRNYRLQVTKPSGCISISNNANLIIGPTNPPITIEPIQLFCDIENAAITDLDITGANLKWYDSTTGGNLLSDSDLLTTNTYYVTQTISNCESFPRLAIDVTIYETVVLSTTIPDLFECDTAVSGSDTDGYTPFDLTLNESILLNGKNALDFSFTYFTDAGYTSQTLTPTTFTNTVQNGQTIYIRIANASGNSCYTDASFTIQVYPLPTIVSIVELTQCDDDTDGISLFNLNEANTLISTNHVNEIFTYYLTDVQAQTGLVVDQITNFTAYLNPTPLNSAVYTRIETSEGCYRTARINLVVGATQIPASFHLDYFECDNYVIDNDNTNGIAAFNFSDAEHTIKNLFPVSLRPQITISYFTNQLDALSELNAIPDISNHRNDASPFTEDIYVRIDTDIVNACLGLGHHITLTVNPLPVANSVSDYVLCSDTDVASFDLSTKTTEVIGAQSLLITYHETLAEAENNVNPITGLYDNTLFNPQIVYVRSQFDDNNNGIADIGECFSTDISFNLVVNQNPVLIQPDSIRICSEQINTTYDLTIRGNQITNGDTSIVLNYYESQLDLDNNNAISSPTNYLNTLLDRDIFVLVTGVNTCTSQTTLSLKTILYVNLNKTPTPIEECEIDNDGYDSFDLRRREGDILNGLSPSDFVFSYYENETDATTGTSNNISDPSYFINTIQVTQTVFARVLPVANECFIVVPIVLIVNPVSEIAIEEEYVICLSSTNASIPTNLTTFLPNPPIDTMLNPTEYTFQWYKGVDDASGNVIVGATASVYIPTEAGDFTVIATNINTGCIIPATTTVVGSYPPESITVELGSDTFSGNNILDVTVVGNGEYEYWLDDGEWQNSPRFERVRGGERIIYVRDIYNCNEITAMQIIIDYPKYFTPNGDGTNDTWNIRGIANQVNARIYVYNRYGKLLKQLIPSALGWNGTFNGKIMPTDDYWFTVEYTEPRDGTIKIFKAHFTLKH